MADENIEEIVAPNDMPSEQSLLGAFLVDDKKHSLWLKTVDYIKPEDFYYAEHVAIAKVMRRLVSEDKPTDPVTVAAALDQQELDHIGGIAYLKKLAAITLTTQNVVYYAQIVQEKSVRRYIMQVSRTTYDKAYSQAFSIAQLKEELGSALNDVSRGKETTIEDVADEAIRQMSATEPNSHWPKCGIPAIDSRIGGFHPGGITIIAGFPGAGKSSLAGFILHRCAARGFPGAYVSLEMSALELFNRWVAAEIAGRNAGEPITNQDLHRMALNASQKRLYEDVAHLVAKEPLWPVDSCPADVSAVCDEIRRRSVLNGCKLFVVDHLGLAVGKNAAGNRDTFLGDFTRQLKNLAKSLGVHIIEISQVNREAARENRELILQDLRDSGNIEANADNVLLLNGGVEGEHGYQEVTAFMAKSRNARRGAKFVLGFVGDYQLWGEPAEREVPKPTARHPSPPKAFGPTPRPLKPEEEEVPFN